VKRCEDAICAVCLLGLVLPFLSSPAGSLSDQRKGWLEKLAQVMK